VAMGLRLLLHDLVFYHELEMEADLHAHRPYPIFSLPVVRYLAPSLSHSCFEVMAKVIPVVKVRDLRFEVRRIMYGGSHDRTGELV
jgi:hypothetical protein